MIITSVILGIIIIDLNLITMQHVWCMYVMYMPRE